MTSGLKTSLVRLPFWTIRSKARDLSTNCISGSQSPTDSCTTAGSTTPRQSSGSRTVSVRVAITSRAGTSRVAREFRACSRAAGVLCRLPVAVYDHAAARGSNARQATGVSVCRAVVGYRPSIVGPATHGCLQRRSRRALPSFSRPVALAQTVPDPVMPWIALAAPRISLGFSLGELEKPAGAISVRESDVKSLKLTAELSQEFYRYIRSDVTKHRFTEAAVAVIRWPAERCYRRSAARWLRRPSAHRVEKRPAAVAHTHASHCA